MLIFQVEFFDLLTGFRLPKSRSETANSYNLNQGRQNFEARFTEWLSWKERILHMISQVRELLCRRHHPADRSTWRSSQESRIHEDRSDRAAIDTPRPLLA